MKIPWAKPFINEEVVTQVLETTREWLAQHGKTS